MPGDEYCVDSCIIIDLNRGQPRDVYPSVWERLEGLVADERAFSSAEIRAEIAKRDDACHDWLRAQPRTFLVNASAKEMAVVAQISAQWPGWVSQGKNGADPWLIAHGAVHGRAIVTSELMTGATDPRNMKIPAIARHFGIPCLTFPDLAREEGWTF